jgi:hypothetical protein
MDPNEHYKQARIATLALNRFRRPSARKRGSEKKFHFNRDLKKARTLWHDDNILGFGVGPKVSKESSKEGKPDFCLVFFVRKKMAKKRLRHLVEIPDRLLLETLDLEIQTDVQEWGSPPVAHSTTFPGGQIGDSFGHAGTMTMAVRDAASGSPLMLSCSHVLARGGEGANEGDLIESPVAPLAPLGTNVVGSLFRFSVLDRNATDNDVDAAVAAPAAGIDISNTFAAASGISGGSISGIRDLTQEDTDTLNDLPLQKLGFVTGVRPVRGKLGNMHIATSLVYHEMSGDPVLDFIELAELNCLSREGDSGAPVLDTQTPPRIVGMNIAGKADGTSLFIHIQKIFDRMAITL